METLRWCGRPIRATSLRLSYQISFDRDAVQFAFVQPVPVALRILGRRPVCSVACRQADAPPSMQASAVNGIGMGIRTGFKPFVG